MRLLDLGCGLRKQQNAIGIDMNANAHPDVIGNIEQGLPFRDKSFDKVVGYSVLEHLSNLDGCVREVGRVLRRGGTFEVFVPHFSNALFYSDPTHKRCFGYFTFDYYCDEPLQKSRWKVPAFYNRDIRLEILEKSFVFSSRFKYMAKASRLIERWANRSEEWKLFYETHLCWLFPCYGIRYLITFRDPSSPERP